MQDTMDIRKWLDETVPPEAPREPIRSQQTAEPAKAQRKLRRKSDSSILDPRPPASPPHEPVDNGVHEVLQATCSDSSNSSRYARKPRRKTRPERYEPGSYAHRHHKGESKRPRRTPRRKKGEKPPGVMQTFQAKNVSGDRLTLKPREQVGLFNKGRTSTAIKGRGLPDLVFSEMKFLQKHKDESVPRPDPPKKRRKRDHVQMKEGEISAFFSSVHPALVEKDSNAPAEHDTSRVKRHRRDQPSVNETAIPTVEVAEPVSYLGFGSRGPRHESTSYVTWSESIRPPSETSAQPHKSPVHHTWRDVNSCDKSGAKKEPEHGIFKLPALSWAEMQPRTNSTPAGRFRLSSLAPSYRKASRSQSFPVHSSSPRRPNLVDRSAKLQEADAACSPLSMPSFAPTDTTDVRHVRPRSSSKGARSGGTPASGAASGAAALAEYRHDSQPGEDSPVDEGRIPTSSDLGVVLQRCNDTFYGGRQAIRPRKKRTERMCPSYPQPETQRNTTNSYRVAQQVPTVRFADQLCHGPILANFVGPSIYEQQARRQQLGPRLELDEDLLQNPYVDQDYLDQDGQMQYDEQDCDDLPEESMSYGFEGDMDMHDEGEAFTGAVDEPVRDQRQGNDTVAPGFWRPNKLY